MAEPNELLRAARERTESPHRPGKPMSRAELAEAVCAWIREKTGRGSGLDANYIGKLERGVVRWPHPAYREGLREVLQVACDDELGFANTFLDWSEARRVRQHGSGDSAPQ